MSNEGWHHKNKRLAMQLSNLASCVVWWKLSANGLHFTIHTIDTSQPGWGGQGQRAGDRKTGGWESTFPRSPIRKESEWMSQCFSRRTPSASSRMAFAPSRKSRPGGRLIYCNTWGKGGWTKSWLERTILFCNRWPQPLLHSSLHKWQCSPQDF